MTECVALVNDGELILSLLPDRQTLCIDVVGHRIYVTVDEWEAMVEAWIELCSELRSAAEQTNE